MLEIGNGDFSAANLAQAQAHMAMWAIMKVRRVSQRAWPELRPRDGVKPHHLFRSLCTCAGAAADWRGHGDA